MRSLWTDAEAKQFLDKYAPRCGEDLALRVYTSRLIGRDDSLVLHGGGNTSVKTKAKDILGDSLDVLCVKGSGWDLVSIEPQGLPAVELAPLLRLRAVPKMSDEEMVAQVRRRLLDPGAPNPSVETFLHAFVPRKFVDHTHADAIAVLTNQPDGRAMVQDALGAEVVVLPWIFPGFPLAHAVADAFDRAPRCTGIVLEKHGIFAFGDTARDSYERMIEMVDRAERFIATRARGRRTMLMPTSTLLGDDEAKALVAEVAPAVRGAVAVGNAPHGHKRVHTHFVMQWRGSDDLRAFTAHPDAARLAALGPLTPDHVIRTKSSYLWLSLEQARDPAKVAQAVLDYQARYTRYFAAHKQRVASTTPMTDPNPRVVLVEGLGVLAFGPSAKAAAICADIAEHTLRGKAQAEAIGAYTELEPGEVFAMEYWSLEVAKLGKQKPLPLAGQVGLVTGAAGAIGFGIARALLDAGAEVVVTDLNEDALARIHNKLVDKYGTQRVLAVRMDVTKDDQVAAAFAEASRRFGGIDIVVPNAGVAYVSKLAEMDAREFRRVVEVNLIGTMTVLREAARIYQRQGIGGAVVVQGSKNVFDPGAGFGAYSASKAGAHQIGKIAALEFAELGVTVNMVNADAVFGDDDVPSGLWEEVGPDRMRARGLDAAGLREFYRKRSLLQREVTPEHVGAAVVFFASGATPTTGATLPVDAGIPGAFPR